MADIHSIDNKVKIREKIGELVRQKPELFREINLNDYTSNGLVRDEAADWISVDDEERDKMATYHFYWKDIQPYLEDHIYELRSFH